MKLDYSAPRPVQRFRYFFRVSVVTIGFSLMLTLTILMGLSLIMWLDPVAYKIVTFFLTMITISNLFSRYITWFFSTDGA